MQRGSGPIIATAIHDGHGLGAETRAAMALTESDRLREEDPHTGYAAAAVPNHVIAARSRFEVDLNREIDEAVYRTPEQSWGLKVWRSEPSDDLVARSLALHSAFYRMMADTLDAMAAQHERFILFDIHSYNHRRDGPGAAATPQEDAPDINIGTYSMPRDHWASVLDPIIEAMRDFNFNGRKLDVRENVAFQGKGALTRFVHARYPQQGCAIAVEFKKFFMDEWSGVPDTAALAAMRDLIAHSAAAAEAALK
ncbi:MAG: N-formylglutamate amidohydrolase [Sphingopyxis sp.]|nr:N-formylglutamate amidohydrolase [Sphingopyxis sp.]